MFDRLFNAIYEDATEFMASFYSSELGGIVTNPAFMVLHMDDHMVHRGHGVYESVLLADGYLFKLPERVQRLRQSAAAAGIEVPWADADLMRIILDTAAASRRSNGGCSENRSWHNSKQGAWRLPQPGLLLFL